MRQSVSSECGESSLITTSERSIRTADEPPALSFMTGAATWPYRSCPTATGQICGGAQPTPEEAEAALIGYTAYFGTYTVDVQAGTVMDYRKGNINPGAITDVVRRYEFVGDNRVILNPVENPANKLTWERVN